MFFYLTTLGIRFAADRNAGQLDFTRMDLNVKNRRNVADKYCSFLNW